MNEQLLNILFVEEVEKHPCLYDYNLAEYSRRDVTENAWSEVGKVVNLTGSQCKEKWKNIRAVFVRHLKPEAKKKKPYYLMEAMQFTIPFIRALSTNVSGNSPAVDHEGIIEDSAELSSSEHDIPTTSSNNRPHSPLSVVSCIIPKSPPNLDTSIKKTKKSKALTSYEKSVRDYFRAKKAKIEETNSEDMDSRKMFLLSLLDDVRSMSDIQMRKFKRKVLEVVDEILEVSPTQNVTNYSRPSDPTAEDVYSVTIKTEHF